MKNKLIFAAFLAIALVAASFYISSDTEATLPEITAPAPPKQIAVFVSGQVKNIAVVRLDDTGNLRAVDAINAAGGLTELADTEAVNLAEPVFDGQHIHIPAKEIFYQEFPTAATANIRATATTPAALININTADEKELQNLKGVGPTIASRIVEYREQNGGFSSIDEIKKVRGIGAKTFDKLKDFITVQ